MLIVLNTFPIIFYFLIVKLCRDGAWVENKGPLLTFHYRDTPTELRPAMIEKARTLIQSFGFTAYESQCALEAKPPVQWNKGIKLSWRRAIVRKYSGRSFFCCFRSF